MKPHVEVTWLRDSTNISNHLYLLAFALGVCLHIDGRFLGIKILVGT